MPVCPTCGSPRVPCPDCDARIISWIEGPSDPPTVAASPDQACTSCGYSGEMTVDDRGTSCPACGVVLPVRRPAVTLRVTQLVDCPECGRQIEITAEDEGKTVVCPGCSYFLGTPMETAGRRRRGR